MGHLLCGHFNIEFSLSTEQKEAVIRFSLVQEDGGWGVKYTYYGYVNALCTILITRDCKLHFAVGHSLFYHIYRISRNIGELKIWQYGSNLPNRQIKVITKNFSVLINFTRHMHILSKTVSRETF